MPYHLATPQYSPSFRAVSLLLVVAWLVPAIQECAQTE